MTGRLREVRFEGTTAADGTQTVRTSKVNGRVRRVIVDATDCDATADFTITDNETPAQPILTLSNIGTTSVVRTGIQIPAYDQAGAAIADTYSNDGIYIHNSAIKIVVAQGGNAKDFSGRILIEEWLPEPSSN